jgi:MEMO1 family protein
MSKQIDENEHSLEMHLPYIKKVLPDVKLIPIMVGNLSAA